MPQVCRCVEWTQLLENFPRLNTSSMCFSRPVIIIIPLMSSFVILSSIIFFISQGSCPDGHFPCGNNEKCVKQRNICDGHFDCSSGEDEEPLYCADLHGGFWGLIDNLQFKPPNNTCDLDEVPPKCVCTDFTVVVCSGQLLTAVPSGISKFATRLILTENNVVLQEADFKSFRFHLIHLGKNNISTLPAAIFHGQKDLQKLFLSENNIIVLPEGIFDGLGQLSWLFADHNKLCELNFDDWELKNLTWLDLSHNELVLRNKSFPQLPYLSLLYLDWNLIKDISELMFSNLPALIDLSLGWNKIKRIHPLAFRMNSHLQELNLRSNELEYLNEEIFSCTTNLTKLDLGGNILLEIGPKLFYPLLYLKSLNLQDIDINNIDVKMFSILHSLDFAYFKRFKYCMYAPHVPKCFPFSDGSSSATDLLSTFLRVTLWLVAAFTITANGLVLWHRLSSLAYTSPLNFLITSLAVSDLLMGVYLVVIGCEDLILKGNYVHNARLWMSSWLCTSAGIIAMLSSEVSVLMLFLISAERYLLIAAPLGEQRSLQPRMAMISVSSVWIFALTISVLPVIHWRGAMRFYGSNGFCFPLHIDDPYLIGWQYSAVVFLGINSFGIIGIALLYFGVFMSIYKTRHATTLNVKDSEFAMKFFFIVITNTCCWMPIIILKILAFTGISLSGELYGWLTVFVLPINSAINPILYTFSIPRSTVRPGDQLGTGDRKNQKRKFSRAIPLNNRQMEIYEPPKTSQEQI